MFKFRKHLEGWTERQCILVRILTSWLLTLTLVRPYNVCGSLYNVVLFLPGGGGGILLVGCMAKQCYVRTPYLLRCSTCYLGNTIVQERYDWHFTCWSHGQTALRKNSLPLGCSTCYLGNTIVQEGYEYEQHQERIRTGG